MDEKKVREAINQFKGEAEAINNTWDSFLDDAKPFMAKNLELRETAIEALEKQLPMKVDKDECTEKTHCKCPTCGRILLTVYADGYRLGTMPKYCEVCGQMLDWSEQS